MSNFFIGSVEVLFPPLVLDYTSSSKLGTILTLGGVSMIFSSILASLQKNIPAKSRLMIFSQLIASFAIMLIGVSSGVLGWGASTIVFFFVIPIIGTLYNSLWHETVEEDCKGRVFAARRMVVSLAIPLAYVTTPQLLETIESFKGSEGYKVAFSTFSYNFLGSSSLLFFFLGFALFLFTVLSLKWKALVAG